MEGMVSMMKAQLKAHDDRVQLMERVVTRLNGTIDDLDQHSRRCSLRVFRVTEEGNGSNDDNWQGAAGLVQWSHETGSTSIS